MLKKFAATVQHAFAWLFGNHSICGTCDSPSDCPRCLELEAW